MPNWCLNSFDVSHQDPAMITKFADAVKAGNLFETFVPLSSGEWDYNVAVEEWGTKWDITAGDVSISEDGKDASGWFDTAWGPGIRAYEKLEELGFELSVLYHESGMCFAGQYIRGEDDCYEYDFGNENWRDDILNDDVMEFLEQEYENWLEWNEENKEEDGSE
jgi:hypothetical protein